MGTRLGLVSKLAPAFALALALAQPALAQDSKSLTIVLAQEPNGLDGCNTARKNVGLIIRGNVIESLTEINAADGTVKPRLATEWSQLDPTTWQFKLRDGVTFHDGTPFNADAVVAAVKRTMNKDIVCENRTKAFGDLDVTPVAVDATTVNITTSKPEPILPARMALVGITAPSTSPTELVLTPVGTGPYAFDHFTAGQEVVINRYDGYWGEKPAVEGATYVWRAEGAVRAAMVEVGEADIAINLTKQDATNPKLDFGFLSSDTTSLRIDQNVAPLDDIRVREALNLAVDRESFRGTILPQEVVLASQIVVPGVAGHNFSLDEAPRPYDPEKAMALLAEAKADGVPVDKEIVLIGRPTGYAGAAEVMEALLAMYQAVGLNVTLRNLEQAEWQTLLNKPFAEDRPPMLLQASHDNNNGDPVFSVFNKYACDGFQSTLCDPELDAKINAATAAIGDERVKLWEEVMQGIYDEVADVWLFHSIVYIRVGERLSFTPSISNVTEIQLSGISFK